MRARIEVSCGFCQTRFITKTHNQKFCSYTCRKLAKKATGKRHHYQAEDGFPCPCGKPIDHPIHIPRIEP